MVKLQDERLQRAYENLQCLSEVCLELIIVRSDVLRQHAEDFFWDFASTRLIFITKTFSANWTVKFSTLANGTFKKIKKFLIEKFDA